MSELERWLEERIAETRNRRERLDGTTWMMSEGVSLGGKLCAFREVLDWIRTHQSENGGE